MIFITPKMLRSLAIFAAVIAQASAFAPGAGLPLAARRGTPPPSKNRLQGAARKAAAAMEVWSNREEAVGRSTAGPGLGARGARRGGTGSVGLRTTWSGEMSAASLDWRQRGHGSFGSPSCLRRRSLAVAGRGFGECCASGGLSGGSRSP